MKALLAALTLVLLGGGGYYVFVHLPGRHASEPVREPEIVPKPQPPVSTGADLAAKAPPPVDKEQKRRQLWTRLRPASERLVPDPDDVGPCPPVEAGGLLSKVVRRYRDPWNGFRVWIHEDGSFTYLHPTASGTDPKTGKALETGEIVTTGVPTEPLPIAPDEAPGSTSKR